MLPVAPDSPRHADVTPRQFDTLASPKSAAAEAVASPRSQKAATERSGPPDADTLKAIQELVKLTMAGTLHCLPCAMSCALCLLCSILYDTVFCCIIGDLCAYACLLLSVSLNAFLTSPAELSRVDAPGQKNNEDPQALYDKATAAEQAMERHMQAANRNAVRRPLHH